MEERYEKQRMEEQREKFQRLKKLMEERRPISFE
jgi:5-bromo-4-chloroindolyl phosphate hydrolysis protein